MPSRVVPDHHSTMSMSPPLRRLSTGNEDRTSKEELINAYEAEEERIINTLSRKLERLREEKIDLENVLEAESESHVNKLMRELTALRLAQQQTASGAGPSSNGSLGAQSFLSGQGPSADAMLEAMRQENEQLRHRLADVERDFIRVSRLNEIYREELIEHRNRLGISVDNLIGLASSDPYSQPTHRRKSSTPSPAAHVQGANPHLPTRTITAVPIPRPASQIRRPVNQSSESTTSLSYSPSSPESPYAFSPLHTNSASFVSTTTNMTSPPSFTAPHTWGAGPGTNTASSSLTYPSVPPPSLSSSFGSPTASTCLLANAILREELKRFRGRVAETGSLADISRSHSHSRRSSVDRGHPKLDSATERRVTPDELEGVSMDGVAS
ncbi:hypothetical protein BD626DRAFT_505397 [Schizophyllum amplum]|uniref:Uncharacterized protein n=1 Tax=Schizophyllum amplum TaxID=97359 RepID=A0A550C6L6_9AGAR|nr:hypothetical protein BD626DRAFT_505397 [Auriculariopsis ampla]